MALGIKQEPNYLMCVGNPIAIVADSSSSHQNNFRYQLKLYTYDLTGYTSKSTLYLYPDINNDGYMVYDLSRLLYNYIDNEDPYIVFSTGMTLLNTEVKYYAKITEYINNIIGNNYSTTPGYTFRGVVQYGETFDENDYIISNNFNFLTKKSVRNYKRDTYSVINYFNIPYNPGCKVVYTLYAQNAGLGFYTYNFPTIFDTSTGMTSIPIGIPQINEMATNGLLNYLGTIPTSGDVIGDNCIQYSIKIQDVSGNTLTDEYFVNINDKYNEFNGVEFVYLGELGTYETFCANYIHREEFYTNFNEIKQNHYRINNDLYSYTIGDRGRKIVNRTTNRTHQVNTDWITDNEISSVLELLNSNDVYVRDGNYLYPVLITNSRYTKYSEINDGLFYYTITYEDSYEKLSV